MIRGFRDKDTERVFSGRKPKKLPSQPKFLDRAEAKLRTLDRVESVAELRLPPSNRLHKLGGDRAGQWSLSIDKQWRVCFEFDEESGDADAVEITDYH